MLQRTLHRKFHQTVHGSVLGTIYLIFALNDLCVVASAPSALSFLNTAGRERFWLSTTLQIAALTSIYGYLDSPLPFCYRQNPRHTSLICITPNTTTCHMWKNKRVHWIEQGLTYRSPDQICTSQMIWLMKAQIYAECMMIAFEIASRRRNAGITPNGVAFSYFTLVATLSIFLLNSYMRSDWRQYWSTAGVYTFSNVIRHEPIMYLTQLLLVIQCLSFIDYFNQLYAKTWANW